MWTLIALGALGILMAFGAARHAVARAEAADAGIGSGDSILDQLVVEDNVVVRHTDEGLVISGGERRGAPAILKTRASFDLPVDITLVAKTSGKSLRLSFGKGEALFNWDQHGKDLRFTNPWDAHVFVVPNMGEVPKDQYVTIHLIVTDREVKLDAWGATHFGLKGPFAGTRGPIGVGTEDDAVVTIKSLTVTHGGKTTKDQPPAKEPTEPSEPKAPVATTGESGKPSGPLFTDVPCAKPTAAARGSSPARAAADDASIERPEFRDKPKPIVKNLSAVTSMMVVRGADGQASGVTSDIIATVPGDSRRGNKAAAGFYRKDGDETMRTAFDEALRAVELRYPLWEPGRIEFSFGEKFTSHAGPSAGTAFGVLMLSCLEGFDVDPKCAITGDVSVDWRVRKVGGVTAKLRGAALDKCTYAAIPVDNATAFGDMALLYGNDSLWVVQVFTIANLQEAVALARTDRPEGLVNAINLFGDLQVALNKNQRLALREPGTKSTLKQILDLAPNHLSAKCVLALCDGTAPKTLSANATAYQLSVIYYPYLEAINKNRNKQLDRTTLPKAVTITARKRLATLRPIAHKDFQPMLADVGTFIETMDELADHSISAATAERRLQDSQARVSAVVDDPKFVENLIREGY